MSPNYANLQYMWDIGMSLGKLFWVRYSIENTVKLKLKSFEKICTSNCVKF